MTTLNMSAPTTRKCILDRPEGWDKTCQECGEDPFPNSIHCPRCKRKILNRVNGVEGKEGNHGRCIRYNPRA